MCVQCASEWVTRKLHKENDDKQWINHECDIPRSTLANGLPLPNMMLSPTMENASSGVHSAKTITDIFQQNTKQNDN